MTEREQQNIKEEMAGTLTIATEIVLKLTKKTTSHSRRCMKGTFARIIFLLYITDTIESSISIDICKCDARVWKGSLLSE